MALKKKAVVNEASYDMRGLFTIVKGQYRKTAPAVVFGDKETRFVGGYDPNSEDTEEWYQLMDTQNFLTVVCGSDLEMIKRGLYNFIIKYNNDRQAYLSEHEVFTAFDDESGKKTKRCKTSPSTTELNRKIYEYYGEYFEDMISEIEEKAIKDLRGTSTPKKTVKKTVGKVLNSPKSEAKTAQPKKSPLKKKEVLKTDVVVEEEVTFDDVAVTEAPKKKVIKKTKTTEKKVASKTNKTPSKGAFSFKPV